MRNILLTIEYCGTNYCGWQIQPNGISIQSTIEKAIKKITGECVSITGSGRTDSGVHAYGQNANFYTNSAIPSDKFCYALNTKLPSDIRIISSKEVSDDFHSRYSAKAKKYLYCILNTPVNSAFERDRAWHISSELNIEDMKSAASHFIGEHDFAAFMSAGSNVKDTVREIYDVSIHSEGNKIYIEFFGNGFLYNMVRIMTGTLYQAAIGKITPAEIPDILKSCDRKKAGITAPAHGLYLKEVIY